MDSYKLKKTKGFYRFGDFKVEADERRLWYEEALVPLTPKEFEVLTFLIERGGKVAGKDELLEAVWTDTFVAEATLARNISWLRKKLRKFSKGEKFIETVPKHGYRFTADVTHITEDENVAVIEEQTIQNFSFEETITIEDKNPEANLRQAVPQSQPEPEPKTQNLIWFAFGSIVIAGIGFIIYQNYFQKNKERSVAESSTILSPDNIIQPSGVINVAFGKAAKQSSNWTQNQGLAINAVDGKADGDWFNGSVTSTVNDNDGSTDPWWEVDLGAIYNISRIEIYNRLDCCRDRLNNLTILTKKDAEEDFRRFVPDLYSYDDYKVNPMVFRNKQKARYVRIQLVGSNKILSLAEVKVFGTPQNCNPQPDQIAIFSEKNFQGECAVLNSGDYPNPTNTKLSNKPAYSIVAGAKTSVLICDQENYQGNCRQADARNSSEQAIYSIKAKKKTFQIRNEENKCLYLVEGGDEDIPAIKLGECNDKENQKWFWTPRSTLQGVGEKCLALSDKDRVVAAKCNDIKSQKWVLTNSNEIRNGSRNRTCLEVNKSENANEYPIRINECQNSENQKWTLVE